MTGKSCVQGVYLCVGTSPVLTMTSENGEKPHRSKQVISENLI